MPDAITEADNYTFKYYNTFSPVVQSFLQDYSFSQTRQRGPRRIVRPGFRFFAVFLSIIGIAKKMSIRFLHIFCIGTTKISGNLPLSVPELLRFAPYMCIISLYSICCNIR